MITFWGLFLGLPLLAFGGAMVFSPRKTKSFADWFRSSRVCAVALTVVAWLWTAHECDTIGIDFFDMLLFKSATGGLFVWILAIVLSYLTVIWMPANLPVRALAGLFMLIPAELFKATRPLLPATGFDLIQVIVAIAYLGALVGMYGMFYPWRLERGLDIVLARGWSARAVGIFCVALGFASIVTGFVK